MDPRWTFVMYLRIGDQFSKMPSLSSMLSDERLDVSLTSISLNSMLHAKIFGRGENCCRGSQIGTFVMYLSRVQDQ